MAYRPELLDVLERLEAQVWERIVYRHMFARLPPTFQNTGGARWNPRRTAAIYASLERETALAEAEFRMSLEPIRPSAGRTLYEIRVRVSQVVDLRPAGVIAALKLSSRDLEDPLDYRRCQEIGGALEFLGRGGALVPSARRLAGTNLVIYPTVEGVDDVFEVIGEETISD